LLVSQELWNSLLDAEMNVRYWSAICRRYARYDLGSRIFLAITSSSTVASWSFWSQWPLIWKSLSGISALIAITLTVVDLPKKVSRISVLVARWKQSQVEYELLWRTDRSLSASHSKSKYSTCKHREITNTSDEQTLPYDDKLLKQCYRDVYSAHGFVKEK
jgi:hypothetical protein